MLKNRNWICTYNNPNVDTKTFLENWVLHGGASFACGQLELGNVERTLHIQYYLHFLNPVRLAQLCKFSDKTHFLVAGNPAACIEYVQKADTRQEGPFLFGLPPKIGAPSKLTVRAAIDMQIDEIY